MTPLLRSVLLAFGLVLATVPAQAQLTPVGLWRNIDDKTGVAKAEIRIRAGADGVVTGFVEKALVTSEQPNCDLCTDDRKGKPKLGMEIIRGAKQAEGEDHWEGGHILDPDNGKTYRCRIKLDKGRLKVRGFIGVSLLGRTQYWHPAR